MDFKKKIIAVDDSGIVLKMLGKLLNEKYDFHAFSGGNRALQFLKDRTPDLIILDIDMPEINGYEMLNMIKEQEHLQEVPVIFLTSNNDKSHVVKAVASGAKDYVVKPIDEDILMEKIHTLLGDQANGWMQELQCYLQEYIRYAVIGRHYKGSFRIRYEDLKRWGYRSLVHEYWEGRSK